MNNPFHHTNVFVSGGAGVIGDALVKKLHAKGANLFVGDLKERPRDWPRDIVYRQGDLNTITKQELLAFRPAAYFHLAATFERTTESYEFWDENFHHNILLSHHLMDCLKDSETLKRIIFASSYLIYDPHLYRFKTPPKSPCSLSENSPISPRNLCGMAKLLHEQELAFLNSFKNGQMTAISARIFRSFGRNSRDVISRWIRALEKNETLTVYNPEGAFDFIFADDVAEGLIRLGEQCVRGIVNLGKGHARAIQDVLDILKGQYPEMKMQIESSDIPFEASQANMEHFQKVTSWLPEHTLEDAIAKIIAYEKKGKGKM